jgi:hypothetical protein
MPQIQLPIFPQGTTHITPELAFERRENQVTYFNGHLPVFTHQSEEKLGAAQALLDQGQRVPQISRELGVLPSTLHKAIDDGRLKQIKKKTRPTALPR